MVATKLVAEAEHYCRGNIDCFVSTTEVGLRQSATHDCEDQQQRLKRKMKGRGISNNVL